MIIYPIAELDKKNMEQAIVRAVREELTSQGIVAELGTVRFENSKTTISCMVFVKSRNVKAGY